MVNYTSSVQGSKGSLSVFFEDGDTKTIANNHPAYADAVAYFLSTPIEEHDEDHVRELLNPALRIGRALKAIDPKFDFDLYTLSYEGLPLTGPLADLIKERLNNRLEGWERFVRFLSSLERNPSFNAKQGLYSWVSKNGLHILEDGRFVAHKGVESDGLSTRSGPNNFINGMLLGKPGEPVRVPHFVGSVVSKRRGDVDDSRAACSTGLHVGTHQYASSFVREYGSSGEGRFLTVAVWPEDVVGGDQGVKIRVCRYEVLALNESRAEFEAGDYVNVPDHTEEVTAFEMKHAVEYPTRSRHHDFSPEEKAEYNVLPSVGRSLYDNLRTQFNKSHDAAYAAAYATYGTHEEWLAARDAERAEAAAQAEAERQAALQAEVEALQAEGEQVKAEETIAVSFDGSPVSERLVVPEAGADAATLADWAAVNPSLQADLEDTSLGHKPLARKWSEVTTESSVRRYRKANNIQVSLRARMGL